MPRWLLPPFVVAAALILCASASAHPSLSPAIVQTGQTQVFTLAVPTEKEGATKTEIELTLPADFEVEAFVPAQGWERTGEGVVKWTGGNVPTGEAALLEFVGGPTAERRYEFKVRQTYSDGSVADWAGSSPDAPAAVVEARASLSGGSNTLSIVAFVIATVALVLGAIALLLKAGEGRDLA